jgi:hypothetical protein
MTALERIAAISSNGCDLLPMATTTRNGLYSPQDLPPASARAVSITVSVDCFFITLHNPEK